MGRYTDKIANAEAEAKRRKDDESAARAAKEAQAKQSWDVKAEPLKLLLSSLDDLRTDVASRGITLEVKDNTPFGKTAAAAPFVDFRLVKRTQLGIAQMPFLRVEYAAGRYAVMEPDQASSNWKPAAGIRLAGGLSQSDIDVVIEYALSKFDW